MWLYFPITSRDQLSTNHKLSITSRDLVSLKTSQNEVQTEKAEEDVGVDTEGLQQVVSIATDTVELQPVDSIATDTDNLTLLHDECSQTLLFETLLLSTPVSFILLELVMWLLQREMFN